MLVPSEGMLNKAEADSSVGPGDNKIVRRYNLLKWASEVQGGKVAMVWKGILVSMSTGIISLNGSIYSTVHPFIQASLR